jgi:transposase
MSHSLTPRRPCLSDMTDKEWEFYQEVFPELRGIPGRWEAKWTTREILNAIRYQERTGCPWRYLPHDVPPWSTVKTYFYTWRDKGLLTKFREPLTIRARVAAGRRETPTACAIDRPTIQTTEAGGPKGLDAGKKKKGRKRHLAVDILGLLLAILITPAKVQDRDAGAQRLRIVAAAHPTIQVAFVDSAHNGNVFKTAVHDTGIRAETSAKDKSVPGFVPVKKRGVVERTHGWMNRSRRLSKDDEATIASSTAWYEVAKGRLLTRRRAGISTQIRV